MKNVSWKRVAVLFFGFWVLGHLVAGCAGTLPTDTALDAARRAVAYCDSSAPSIDARDECYFRFITSGCTSDSECAAFFGGEY